MRVLALDLGTRRVGVAVSDTTGTLASPLTTVARSGDERADHGVVARLVAQEEAAIVVVGLPLRMDGTDGPAASAARREAVALAAVVGVPVELADERLTTVSAERVLIAQGRRGPARRRVIDKTAATVLLQSWLEGPGGRRLRLEAGGGVSAGGGGADAGRTSGRDGSAAAAGGSVDG